MKDKCPSVVQVKAYSEWSEVRFAVNMTAVGSMCSHRESVTTAELDGSFGQHEEESLLLIGLV